MLKSKRSSNCESGLTKLNGAIRVEDVPYCARCSDGQGSNRCVESCVMLVLLWVISRWLWGFISELWRAKPSYWSRQYWLLFWIELVIPDKLFVVTGSAISAASVPFLLALFLNSRTVGLVICSLVSCITGVFWDYFILRIGIQTLFDNAEERKKDNLRKII